jgi:hypothetical protein
MRHGAPGIWTWKVPAEMRAVITNIDAYSQGAVGAGFKVYTGTLYFAGWTFPATGTEHHVTCKGVCYQGDIIGMEILNPNVFVHISGFLFADKSGRTGPPQAPSTKPIEPEPPRLELLPDR